MFDRLRTRLGAGQQDGFTLIEMLIVIVVLGILGAIVTFGVSQFRSDSVNQACKTDVKNVETASTAHHAKNNPASYVDVPALVTAGYLKTNPNNSRYTIAVNSSTGAVTATNLTVNPSVTGCPA